MFRREQRPPFERITSAHTKSEFASFGTAEAFVQRKRSAYKRESGTFNPSVGKVDSERLQMLQYPIESAEAAITGDHCG
jgi:hypothetical protein